MVYMKKVINHLHLIVLFALVFFTTLTVSADIYIPSVKNNIYVYDSAKMLSTETVNRVNYMMEELEAKTEAEVLVVTVPSLDGYDIESYANRLFNTVGIGTKEDNNGVLLLIAQNEYRVRLEIGVGLEDVLTDSVSGRILDDYFVPYRANSDYDSAVIYASTAVANMLANHYDVTLSSTDPDIKIVVHSTLYYIIFDIICVSVFLAIIILLVIIILYVRYFSWRLYSKTHIAKKINQMEKKYMEDCIASGRSFSSSSSSGSSSHSSSSSSGGGRSGGGGASR